MLPVKVLERTVHSEAMFRNSPSSGKLVVAVSVLRSTVWKDNVVAGAWMMVLVGAVCGLMYYVRKRYPGKRKVGGTMDTVISALLILFCVVYVGMGAMALVAMNK